MTPPIFSICAGDSTVSGLLDDGTTLRLFPFGEAPQAVERPYALWGVADGAPENYIGDVPDTDVVALQVDVYGSTAASAREVRDALVAAIEPHAHVISWDGERRDPDTRTYRISFTVDWIVHR